MWKISRNIILYRWPKQQQKYAETPKPISASIEQKRYSDQGKKEKKFKQNEKFWDCNHVKFLLFKSAIIEKAGWLGAVSILCFNLHFKHFKLQFDVEKRRNYCIFSRNVLALPEVTVSKRSKPEKLPVKNDSYTEKNIFKLVPPLCIQEKSETLNLEPDSLKDFQNLAAQYATAVFNVSGISHLKSNKKKAFRYFQKAARLGSSQAFYNLGLCFELGEGTQKNLSRAAFCYRKAAMTGHGLASFNLAVFFLRGLGGLPVDTETAKHLLFQAAEKGVPEAQLYIGQDFLKQKRYSEAFQVFNSLAEKNILDGKYYLGMCYENGWGVNKDQRIATELFSEAAASGHSKSVIKLSRYYEDGIGGCETDIDFSTALCQMLDDKKNKDLQESLVRLKLKKATFMLKRPITSSCLKKEETILRNSKSVPELSSYQKTFPLYLDVASLFWDSCDLKQKSLLSVQEKNEYKSIIPSVSLWNRSLMPKC